MFSTGCRCALVFFFLRFLLLIPINPCDANSVIPTRASRVSACTQALCAHSPSALLHLGFSRVVWLSFHPTSRGHLPGCLRLCFRSCQSSSLPPGTHPAAGGHVVQQTVAGNATLGRSGCSIIESAPGTRSLPLRLANGAKLHLIERVTYESKLLVEHIFISSLPS